MKTNEHPSTRRLQQLNRMYHTISRCNHHMVRAESEQALAQKFCSVMVEEGAYRMAWVGYAENDEARSIRPVAYAGFESGYLENLNLTWADTDRGSGPGARCIREQTVQVTRDIANDARFVLWREEAARRGYASSIALPLKIGTGTLGFLGMYSERGDAFDEEEIGLLTEAADDLAYGITALRDRRERDALARIRSVLSGINSVIVRVHEREGLLRDACRIAVEQGGFGMVWIGLLDAGGQEVKVAAHHGFAPDVPGGFQLSAGSGTEIHHSAGCRAILDRAPFVVNDLAEVHPHNQLQRLAVGQGYRSVIALPLIAAGAATGVVIMYAREVDFFNADEVKLLSELAGDISRALEHIGHEERLKFLANYDPLTGLPNRALIHERLTQLLAEARHKQTHTAVAVADIKRFRLVNESFGRQAGDRVLRELAQRLRAHSPEPLDLARVAPDSFALILTGTGDAANIATTLEHCLGGALAAPFLIDGNETRIAMTTGVAVFPPDGDDADALFRNAEAALKRAKRAGDRILFYHPEMNARVAETLILENRLRRAIEEEQFVLHYQPKISAASGRITGLEALIRWLDPVAGLVPPGKFIPILEETGMILDVGAWTIRKALIESRNWRLTHTGPLRIAVNVSAIQLRQRDFVDTVKRSIDGLGIAAAHLDLELTESMIMEGIEENVHKLQAIRDMGVNVAVDDFGTGYSSLAYLAKLPVNTLKIDRSFVDTMTRNPHSMTLVSTIISLAHALDLKVVAEGVESEEQAKLLRLLKCDELQGYLFSKPLAPGEVQDFLLSGGTQPDRRIELKP